MSMALVVRGRMVMFIRSTIHQPTLILLLMISNALNPEPARYPRCPQTVVNSEMHRRDYWVRADSKCMVVSCMCLAKLAGTIGLGHLDDRSD